MIYVCAYWLDRSYLSAYNEQVYGCVDSYIPSSGLPQASCSAKEKLRTGEFIMQRVMYFFKAEGTVIQVS